MFLIITLFVLNTYYFVPISKYKGKKHRNVNLKWIQCMHWMYILKQKCLNTYVPSLHMQYSNDNLGIIIIINKKKTGFGGGGSCQH